MTNKERVIAALSNVELCDDCLSVASSVTPRQSVYSICRSLSDESYIIRHHGQCEHCHKLKTTSRLKNTEFQFGKYHNQKRKMIQSSSLGIGKET